MMTRSVVVQSILYGNEPESIERAVSATAHALKYAQNQAIISFWTIALGDCLPEGSLTTKVISKLKKIVTSAGGTFLFEYFNENLGHGGGHNRLSTQTTTDFMLILNPDVVLAYDAIYELALAVVDDVGASDARQLPLDHAKYYDPITLEQSWASGACLMTTREVFTKIGGFDHETFFMYCDDVDYSWRTRLAGYKVTHTPSARAFHDKRLTLDADIVASSAERYYSAEAAVLLAYKYSNKRLTKKLLKSLKQDGSDVSLAVLAEFDKRSSSGMLPAQIDRNHKVSYFSRGQYAPHRF
jgi:GT2 family glycosyltransferase